MLEVSIDGHMNASIAKRYADARLSPSELRSRWQQMLENRMLADVPGKLELNEKGAIELSPASTNHSILQGAVARELGRLRPTWTTLIECAIETELGIRVPDVGCASPEFMARHGKASPLPRAPELCVEVLSPSNTSAEMNAKTAAYLAAGAVEVWHVAEDGAIVVFAEGGRLEASGLVYEIGKKLTT